VDLLGLKAVPHGGFRRRTRLWRTRTDVKSEMSDYLRLLAGCVCPLANIWGYFNIFLSKVKKKISTDDADFLD